MEELRARVHDHTHPAARSKAQLQDGHGQAQFLDRATPGVREIVLHCQAEGCTFSTLKSSDSTALVKHLDIHTRSVHGAVVSDNDGRVDEREYSRPSKENRELQAALATRKVVKILDDANLNLCEARFFAFPINLKVLGQNMPVTATPVNTIVDLSHLGVDVTNAELLRKVHSRGDTSVKLKHFSNTNIRSSQSSSDELVAIQAKLDKNQLKLGRHLKEIATAQEALIAIFNYVVLCRNFHPLDTSQMALLRVALEKFFSGPPSAASYSRFFEKFVHESSVRAHMKAVPLSYKEILDIWNTYIEPPSVTQVNIEKMVDQKIRQMSGVRGKNKSKGDKSDSRAKKPRIQWCPNWNASPTAPFCTNQQIVGGCTDDSGSQFVHSCSYKVAKGRTCGSKKHNKHTH